MITREKQQNKKTQRDISFSHHHHDHISFLFFFLLLPAAAAAYQPFVFFARTQKT